MYMFLKAGNNQKRPEQSTIDASKRYIFNSINNC